jgi:large subunit ribosomal protein L25
MKTLDLKAFPRTQKRRKGSKILRSQGRIPATIYGKSIQPANLELDAVEFDTLIHSAHSEVILLNLAISGEANPRMALVQVVQHHPLTGHILHVDLHEVKADEKVSLRVPVEAQGEPVGVRTGGGTLEHVLLKLRVRALPKDLPEQILVDVSGLEVGRSIHIGELKAPEGVEILGLKNVSVFAVAAPVKEEAAPAAGAAAGEEGKQPEMIKEKKGEEGAAAPAAKADDKKAAEKKK